jgi:hypothetical protein
MRQSLSPSQLRSVSNYLTTDSWMTCATGALFIGLTKLRHLAARRRPRRVTRQTPLPGLQELLRPAVIEALRNTLPPAQLGNARLATQAVQDNPDLLLSRILLAGRPPNALHEPLGRSVGRTGFLSHLVSLTVTMSPKSSLPQPAKSVSVALTPDKHGLTLIVWNLGMIRHDIRS